MRIFLHILLLLLVSFSLQAELYKGIDEHGNVYFTDKEIPDSEKIPMHMPTVIQMPKPEDVKQTTEKVSKDTSYTSFKILHPANDDTIRNNNGNITVSLALTPELNTASGHKISVSVDGKVVIQSTALLTVQLTNIDRGSHTIQATVINKKGKTIKSSNSITVHLKRKGLTPVPHARIHPDNPEVIIFSGPGPDTVSYRPGPH